VRRFNTLQWRMIAAFILVVAVILAISGFLINRIFVTYMRQDQASQFADKVKVVADFLNFYNDVYTVKGQMPELEGLLGVKLTLVTNPIQPGLPGPLGSSIQFYGVNKTPLRPHLSLFEQVQQIQQMQAVVPFFGDPRLPAWVLVDRNEDLTTARSDLKMALLELSALGLLVSTVLAAWLGRSFSRPLRELALAAEDMADGNLDRSVPESGVAEVQTLARRFNEMSGRLQESFQTITTERDRLKDFIADMSHELRTPLTALSTFNQLLLEGAAEDPATRQEFLDNSAKQIERLRRLSENLLQLSKLDSGLIEMRLEPGDLVETVEESVDRLAPAARARGLELTATLPSGRVGVDHDVSYLQQAIDNLIGNAIKYTPTDGLIEVDLGAEGTEAVLRVRNSGPGIDPADVPNLFHRFFRGRLQAKEEGGSGLGLAIVAAVVGAHRGSVAVTDPARAEFTVRLPLSRGAAQPTTLAPPTPPAALPDDLPGPPD
jgi:signal transduction histidine kinase